MIVKIQLKLKKHCYNSFKVFLHTYIHNVFNKAFSHSHGIFKYFCEGLAKHKEGIFVIENNLTHIQFGVTSITCM